MGLDLYIEARIKEKKTGKIITVTENDEYEEEKGYFEVCYWPTWTFADIRMGLISICNRHGEGQFTDSDFWIPIPQSALRDIYEYLMRRACLTVGECLELFPEEEVWSARYSYEIANLQNAEKVHEVWRLLSQIESENRFGGGEWVNANIASEEDRKLFEENPQGYEWEFRIFNSY